MAEGEKITAQGVATTFESGDLMTIVQSGSNKSVDHDILMDDPQVCKAWVNYNGLTNTIIDDFNTSSVTDNGTGDYTINLTNPVSNAFYSVGFGGTLDSAVGSHGNFIGIKTTNGVVATKNTSALRVFTKSQSFSATDLIQCNVQIFGL